VNGNALVTTSVKRREAICSEIPTTKPLDA
jgi:hypothetical protein